MKTYRLRDYVWWIFGLAVQIYIFWLGPVNGSPGASRVMMLIYWFYFTAMLLHTVTADKLKENTKHIKRQAKRHHMPMWAVKLDGIYDIAMTVALCWYGWVATSIAYAFASLMCYATRDERWEEANEQATVDS